MSSTPPPPGPEQDPGWQPPGPPPSWQPPPSPYSQDPAPTSVPPGYGPVQNVPFGGYGPYGDFRPGDQVPPQGSPTMAIWAFALALLICVPFGWVVSIGLAIAALVRGEGRANTGRGLAIAALVIDSVWLVLAVVVGLLAANGTFDKADTPTAERSGAVSVESLAPGDCFDDPDLLGIQGDDDVQAPAALTLLSCSEDHDFEVFATVELDGGAFPGDDAILDAANKRCGNAFRDYATRRIPPDLSLYFCLPSSVTWRLDDHSITCLAGLPGEKLTRSLRG
ncbi:MAG: hypothetical protein U0R80_09980 [Nocardioidaceae bacterium]